MLKHPKKKFKPTVLFLSLAALGLIGSQAHADTYSLQNASTGRLDLTDQEINSVLSGKVSLLTTTKTNQSSRKIFGLFHASQNASLSLSGDGSTAWTLDTTQLNCSDGQFITCSSLMSDSNVRKNFATVDSGATLLLQSTGTEKQIINAGSFGLSLVHKTNADFITNTSLLHLNNISFRMDKTGIALTDIRDVSGVNDSSVVSNPKPRGLAFSPSIKIENSEIISERIGSFSDSDVYIENTNMYTPIPNAPAGLLFPEQTFTSNTSCGSCSGITLLGRNARLVGKNIEIWSHGSAISSINGTFNYGTNLPGYYGTVEIDGGKLTSVKDNATVASGEGAVMSSAELITRLNFNRVDLTSYGNNSHGIFINYGSAQLSNSKIVTNGAGSHGFYHDSHGVSTLSNTTITTLGDGSYGLYGTGNTGSGTTTAKPGPIVLDLSNTSIFTKGSSSHAAVATAVSTYTGSIVPTKLSLSGDLDLTRRAYQSSATLMTEGANARVIYAHAGANIFLDGVLASSKGSAADVLFVNQSVSGGGIYYRSWVDVKNSGLFSEGDNAHIVHLVNRGQVNASNIVTQTQGAASHYLFVEGNGDSINRDVQAYTLGAGADLIRLTAHSGATTSYSNRHEFINSSFSSTQGRGIVIEGGDNTTLVFDNTKVFSNIDTPDNRIVLHASAGTYSSPANITVNAQNASYLSGDVVLKDSSSLTSFDLNQSSLIGSVQTSNSSQFNSLTLSNNSRWQGAAISDGVAKITQLMIDGSSRWDVTGASTSYIGNVSNLGQINFISLSNQRDVQTIQINGDYAGGGILRMNGVYRSDNADSLVDKLIITGNVSGNTLVYFTSIDNIGAQTINDGIKVIEAFGDSDASNFEQAAPLYAGLYEYRLRGGKADGSFDGAWYLSSNLLPEPPPAVEPPNPEPPATEDPPLAVAPPVIEPPVIEPPVIDPPIIVTPSITSPKTPNYRPDVMVSSILPALTYSVGITQLASYQERIAGTDNAITTPGFWSRAIAQKTRISYGNNGSSADKVAVFERQGANYQSNTLGFQVGMDIISDGAASQNTLMLSNLVRSGVYAGLLSSKADVDHVITGSQAGEAELNTFTLGAYHTVHSANNWYSDTQINLNFFTSAKSFAFNAQDRAKTHGMGVTVSTELGYRHLLGNNYFVEPQGQIIYQHNRLNDLHLDRDLTASFSNMHAFTGRLGVRLARQLDNTPQSIAYIRANVVSSYQSHAGIRYSNPLAGKSETRQLSNQMYGNWVQLDAGINRAIGKSSYGYIAVDYAQGLGVSKGNQLSLKLGIKSTF